MKSDAGSGSSEGRESMSVVVGLVDRLGTGTAAERAVVEQFAVWRADGATEASILLEMLAARARVEVEALDVLLRLVDRHGLARPAIHRLLIDPNDVADAEQATLAAVGLKVTQFEGRSRFTTWLHTIAANEAKSIIRSRERKPAMPTDELEPSPFLARLSTMVASRDQVDRAMASLPNVFRDVLVLREQEGFSYAEIADSLGVEIGTVRSRISRGRALLIAALEGLDE